MWYMPVSLCENVVFVTIVMYIYLTTSLGLGLSILSSTEPHQSEQGKVACENVRN